MKVRITALFLLLYVPGFAMAEPEYVLCNDCPETGYRQAARAHQPAIASDRVFEVYVADVARQNLRRFRVTEESEPGLTYRFVRQIEPDSAELRRFQAFLTARAYLFQELGLFDFTIEVPPGHFTGSAYDLWGSHRNRLLVQEQINAQLSFLEIAFSNFLSLGAFILDRSDSNLFVKVKFPDGSVALFELAGKMEDLVWRYTQGASIDEDGNLIPDRLRDFDSYSGLFNPDSVREFILRAILYGIPVVDKSGNADRLAVVCVQSASGEYTCVVSPA